MREDVETQIVEHGLAALVWVKEKTAGVLRVAARQQWALSENYEGHEIVQTRMRQLAVRLYASASDTRRDIANLRERIRNDEGRSRVERMIAKYGPTRYAARYPMVMVDFEDLP